MLIKIFIALKYVIAFIVTSLYGGGEFVRTVVDEAKDEAKGEAKKRVGAFILPFLFKKETIRCPTFASFGRMEL